MLKLNESIEQIRQVQRALAEIDAACQFRNDVLVYAYPTYIGFQFPMSAESVRAFRQTTGKRLERLYSHVSGFGDLRWNCQWRLSNGETVEVYVFLSTDVPGATCRRVQVGVKSEPVYEIVCEAGVSFEQLADMPEGAQ